VSAQPAATMAEERQAVAQGGSAPRFCAFVTARRSEKRRVVEVGNCIFATVCLLEIEGLVRAVAVQWQLCLRDSIE
jgi:hypothetical protein